MTLLIVLAVVAVVVCVPMTVKYEEYSPSYWVWNTLMYSIIILTFFMLGHGQYHKHYDATDIRRARLTNTHMVSSWHPLLGRYVDTAVCDNCNIHVSAHTIVLADSSDMYSYIRDCYMDMDTTRVRTEVTVVKAGTPYSRTLVSVLSLVCVLGMGISVLRERKIQADMDAYNIDHSPIVRELATQAQLDEVARCNVLVGGSVGNIGVNKDVE